MSQKMLEYALSINKKQLKELKEITRMTRKEIHTRLYKIYYEKIGIRGKQLTGLTFDKSINVETEDNEEKECSLYCKLNKTILTIKYYYKYYNGSLERNIFINIGDDKYEYSTHYSCKETFLENLAENPENDNIIAILSFIEDEMKIDISFIE